MAGFAKLTFVGEHYGQSIVNVFHYRSDAWLPLLGNPFADMLKVIDDFTANCLSEWLNCHTTNYRVLRMEGVGYDNAYTITTPAPVVRTLGNTGTFSSSEVSGSAPSCNLSFQLGAQHAVNGIGTSKRNRGYLSIGPVPETAIDNYGHVVAPFYSNLEDFAQKIDDTLIDIPLAADFVPIRIHEKFTRFPRPIPDVLLWRTYSDILGYRMPRMASYRRSRQTEA